MESWQHIIRWVGAAAGLSPETAGRLVLSIVVWLAYFAARVAVSAFLARRVRDVSKKYLLTKSTRYALGFAVLIATLVIWFGNVTGWAAYLGILSAGLAIALQDPLTNFAGWIFLALRKPFAVGDRVQIGEHRGDVIDMRLFQFTLVEVGNWVNADQSTGRIIHIPNGWVFKFSTANYAQGFNFIWNELPVMVTFESNWAEAKRILAEIATRHTLIESQQAASELKKASDKYMIYFQHLTPIVWTSVADSGVTLTVRYICEPRKRRSSEGAIWEDILHAFAATRDIDFAYPTTRFYDTSGGKPSPDPAGDERSPHPRQKKHPQMIDS